MRIYLHLALVTVTACSVIKDAPAEGAGRVGGVVPVDSGTGVVASGGAAAGSTPAPSPAEPDSVRRPQAPLVPTPDPVRGLYVNRWAALGRKMWELIDVAKRTEVNALVIDVKDDRGLVLYRSDVPLAREIGADAVQPMSYARMRAILDTMRAHNIYPIARIVVAKDPLLADRKREWAVKRKSDGTPWLDRHKKPWLDPTNPGVWKYAADLAAEAVRMGFSEIQLDYVRFPDEDRIIHEGEYAHMNGRVRAQVIRDQLGYIRRLMRPLRVPMAIDVFGLTATDTTDMGIGQRWEQFIDQADVVLPMAYPSHYAPGTYGLRYPNASPYATIDNTLKDAKRRSQGIAGAAKLVPYYQDFTMGPPRYGTAQVRAQMKAGYDNGVRGWVLWNPGSRYTLGALRPEGARDDDAPTAPPRA
ncbi:MAG: putative glycoside hydrolase, partial [Gemmatimonadota bacterium]|nr:putative glycoside hydrolase [Gemmatimonadota bacterium]